MSSIPLMSTLISRKVLTSIAAASVLALTLTSCANGQNAPTRNIKKVTDGAEADSGGLKARDLLLVAQPDGSAVLVATVVNETTTPDAITGISVNGVAAVLPAPIALLQDLPAIFAGDSANQSLVIPGLKLAPSQRVPVVITFEKAGPMTLNAIVREQAGIYANTTK
jgi:hypothetical protein